MKKGIIGILLAALLVFSMGTIAVAGIDLIGEMNYEVGEEVVDGYTQVAVTLAPDPFDLSVTWRRDWIPTLGDSLLMDAGISLGNLRLGYARELLGVDVGVASLTLTTGPLVTKYARTLDGMDLGTLTVDLTPEPFTFTYTNTFDGTAGTLYVKYEKSF